MLATLPLSVGSFLLWCIGSSTEPSFLLWIWIDPVGILKARGMPHRVVTAVAILDSEYFGPELDPDGIDRAPSPDTASARIPLQKYKQKIRESIFETFAEFLCSFFPISNLGNFVDVSREPLSRFTFKLVCGFSEETFNGVYAYNGTLYRSVEVAVCTEPDFVAYLYHGIVFLLV